MHHGQIPSPQGRRVTGHNRNRATNGKNARCMGRVCNKGDPNRRGSNGNCVDILMLHDCMFREAYKRMEGEDRACPRTRCLVELWSCEYPQVACK